MNGAALPSLMKAVWTLVVGYSGPFGLAVYWYAGRTGIDRDSLWRRGLRSTAHCYSGCGAGEVLGVLLAAGLLSLGSLGVTVITFAFAYVIGYAFTVGPMLQEGVGLREALRDAVLSETPSITTMEVVAVGVDRLVSGNATVDHPLFWGSLVLSLSLGYVAAYPVNAGLIVAGVKEGMGNPAEMG